MGLVCNVRGLANRYQSETEFFGNSMFRELGVIGFNASCLARVVRRLLFPEESVFESSECAAVCCSGAGNAKQLHGGLVKLLQILFDILS